MPKRSCAGAGRSDTTSCRLASLSGARVGEDFVEHSYITFN